MSHKLLVKAGIATTFWVAQAFVQVFTWDADFRNDVDGAVGIYTKEDLAALQCSSFDLFSAAGQFLGNPLRNDGVIEYFPMSADACKNGRSPFGYLLGSDLVPYAWSEARWDGTLWRLLKLSPP